ncbi:type II toxin-antitoxin system mRNA interferase toxin, RelE/StbE family [Selenomonas ruminantium]|uniref:type II toxin-antitoxin system mRNA interferase toxin, RelE/StbE family n=1 Tax=Selenomonas ruminantium TaxID=971 RepID=UPI0009B68CF4|nr:type II toxin-antitoxin system mRNA interferase toxin, RelE/StbE family [Selenomonas ruminantium]
MSNKHFTNNVYSDRIKVSKNTYQKHGGMENEKGLWLGDILPDWLLVYKIVDNELTLVLARTGTHSDLF